MVSWYMENEFYFAKRESPEPGKKRDVSKGTGESADWAEGERGVFGSVNNEDMLGNGNNYETPRRDGEMRCTDLRGRSRNFGIAEAGSA